MERQQVAEAMKKALRAGVEAAGRKKAELEGQGPSYLVREEPSGRASHPPLGAIEQGERGEEK